ncbi:hypothetical protein ANTPLA_LOCUS5516 [Anthophora plagiata]
MSNNTPLSPLPFGREMPDVIPHRLSASRPSESRRFAYSPACSNVSRLDKVFCDHVAKSSSKKKKVS